MPSTRFAASMLLAVTIVTTVTGCGSREPNPQRPPGMVRVEFVTGNETRTVVLDEVADGTTLETVMRQIDEIPIEIRSSGVTAFVDAIDGVHTNQSEGWTFRINGEYSGEGIGSLELHPPATVTWRFGSWDEDVTEERP